ncbi:Bowman birk trypsin inhibitor [Medicago truncatula]|uniref:Bowman birk trypsin inhibitor n=1 Tax=Medicago truncatula TaxID=3880 RepID=G7L4K6_MEDTR|nr:Bowman birk trypsin inhibitor [Medicago truncatula]
MMKLALLVFLLGFTSTVVDARFDPTSFITQVISNGEAAYDVKSTTTGCCNSCQCTRSFPQACCLDCVCTKFIPPQCRCHDVTTFWQRGTIGWFRFGFVTEKSRHDPGGTWHDVVDKVYYCTIPAPSWHDWVETWHDAAY